MPKTSDTGLSVQYNSDIGEIEISLSKGKGKEKVVLDSRTFSITNYSEEIQSNIHVYGLSKVLQDRVSAIDMDSKLSAMDEVSVQLAEGKWKKDRVVGAPVVSAEVEALAILKGVTIPDVQKALKKYDKDARKAILASDAVQEQAKEIREERATSEVVSLDDLVS